MRRHTLAPLAAVISIAAFALSQAAEAQTPLIASRVASGLARPVFVTAPPGDYDRLFIVEQHTGLIKIMNLRTGAVLPTAFLNVRAKVSQGDEQGLLGLAFHPDYDSNGFFYIHYTDVRGDTVVSRYHVSGDPDVAETAESVILTADQPFSNHNGGMLAFGPNDDYLYIGLGDGGDAGDPGDRAQSLGTVLGKLLRIDVDSASPYGIPPTNPFAGSATARQEIWNYGQRNPWRFSFDRANGDLYIGDVGQNLWEEISFQAGSSAGGENYGWRLKEATHCYNPVVGCDPGGLVDPIHEYFHSGGRCSVTGGYVYRGCAIPDLQGTYFFADYCANEIFSFRYDGTTMTEFQNRTTDLRPSDGTVINLVSSFGEDAAGEMYIVDLGGEIYKIVKETGPLSITLDPQVSSVPPGTTFSYDITVRNSTAGPLSGDAWVDAFKPSGRAYAGNPIVGPRSFTIAANRAVTRTQSFRIPGHIPPSGPYTIKAFLGTFPGTIIDQDCFLLRVLP